jgi:hypothetical protein
MIFTSSINMFHYQLDNASISGSGFQFQVMKLAQPLVFNFR